MSLAEKTLQFHNRARLVAEECTVVQTYRTKRKVAKPTADPKHKRGRKRKVDSCNHQHPNVVDRRGKRRLKFRREKSKTSQHEKSDTSQHETENHRWLPKSTVLFFVLGLIGRGRNPVSSNSQLHPKSIGVLSILNQHKSRWLVFSPQIGRVTRVGEQITAGQMSQKGAS